MWDQDILPHVQDKDAQLPQERRHFPRGPGELGYGADDEGIERDETASASVVVRRVMADKQPLVELAVEVATQP